jgi:hypothetical protein
MGRAGSVDLTDVAHPDVVEEDVSGNPLAPRSSARHAGPVDPLSPSDLAAGLDDLALAPPDVGRVELVVCRPADGERDVLAEGRLDPVHGMVGDNWEIRGSRHTPDGSAHPGKQVTLMGARAARLVAGDVGRWPLAGDQLYVDLDLSEANLPAGSRLHVGTAVIEISDQPHTGCAKFARRFGPSAVALVSSPAGRALRVRGVNARVVTAGTVRPGDVVRRLDGRVG